MVHCVLVYACFSRVSLIIMSHGTTALELGMFVAWTEPWEEADLSTSRRTRLLPTFGYEDCKSRRAKQPADQEYLLLNRTTVL